MGKYNLFTEIRGTSNRTLKGQEISSELVLRYDNLFGNVTRISEYRAGREQHLGVKAETEIEVAKNCRFCNYKEQTPEPRVHHASGAVSFPNLYPWEEFQWVTAYPPFEDGNHKVVLSRFDFRDLESMLESQHDIASILYNMRKEKPYIRGVMDFTNWGPFAGASQQHPHSQRQSITHRMGPTELRELENSRHLHEKFWGTNPFDAFIEDEVAAGSRVIFNSDEVYIGANPVPSRPHEVVAIPKRQFSNILETSSTSDRTFIKSLLGVLPAMRYYLGISDLNMVVHQAPFDEIGVNGNSANRYYRWHMHIYPRKSGPPSDIAGAELGSGISISTVMPETTAEQIRHWFRDVPDETPVIEPLRPEFAVQMNGGRPHA